MTDDETSRVRLNLRVDKDVKQAFNAEVESKFGACRPYAGIELERELRCFLDTGEVAELRDAVYEVAATQGSGDSKEKIREPTRETTTVASHRIAEDVRTAVFTAANNDFRSPGELVEAIMHGYVTTGSVVERMTQKLRTIAEHSQPDVDESMGAKQRRTKTIARELSDVRSFTLDDFDEAIEVAKGISASDYTREQYLPRVLDELDFTWHPENSELFVHRESDVIPGIRDSTGKPQILMDRSDRRFAIKLAAYRTAKNSSMSKTKFTVDEAVDVLSGRVRKSTVRSLMQEIAESSPGYNYNRGRSYMTVSTEEVQDHESQNNDVLDIETGI